MLGVVASLPLEYVDAPDVKRLVDEIIDSLDLFHIVPQFVYCCRSKGSKSRGTVARIYGLGKIWQEVLLRPPAYVIEVISERYDTLNEEEKERTLIHELLHIPKGFSGGFRPHKGYINKKQVEKLHRALVEKRLLIDNEVDRIYRNTPLEEIPWNIETPPKALVELVESRKVKPCKTIDLGCGTGNYAIYLAGIGFEVTGIDISPTAIKIAKENAKKKGVKCNFLVTDVLGNLDEVKETFDFAYDWELLHHIFPEQRKKYVENVYRILNPKGKYLSVCFSEKDPEFGGSGKYRQTQLDTILYFSSEDELRDLFEPYFNIKELKTIEIRGKSAPHLANYAFMERKSRTK